MCKERNETHKSISWHLKFIIADNKINIIVMILQGVQY